MNMGNVLNESALRFYIWLTRSNFETHLLKSKIHLGSWERVIKTIRKRIDLIFGRIQRDIMLKIFSS